MPRDAFVTKLNPAGSSAIYSTYLGGSGYDAGTSIALDATGDAYVVGYTNSTNFPTVSAFQPSFGGSQDAFVAALDAAGSALLYSSYLGGSNNDWGYGVALDAGGNAYLAGEDEIRRLSNHQWRLSDQPERANQRFRSEGGCDPRLLQPIATSTPTATHNSDRDCDRYLNPNGYPNFNRNPDRHRYPNVQQPKTKDDCKDGRWQNFCNPTFKNQGQCVSWVNHNI